MANNPQLQKLRADITKKLHEPNQFNNYLAKIEEKTGVERFYLVSGELRFIGLQLLKCGKHVGIGSIVGLYLLLSRLAQLFCALVGFIYPAYAS
jgi:hypothetical protein